MGDRMREARETLDLSLQAAAERADISPGYLFKLESGYVGTPSPRILHRLAGVLDVGYWELMSLADYVVPEGEEHQRRPEATPPAQSNRSPDRSPDRSLERVIYLLEEVVSELRRMRSP
ncbi:Transcriptional regulator, contains XRE-family HTH domain [Sinosporangium album]|uniref:Transcriptional regulator, contains XRE-family HTH domain n=2 Tax=Sinosporangium album TaxID=504805 RepID=A0A1G7SGR4_9ACTN|nr:Transcriptional regulator, contains XRE-family HTH domain [Sinosporangium album]